MLTLNRYGSVKPDNGVNLDGGEGNAILVVAITCENDRRRTHREDVGLHLTRCPL